MTLSRVYDGSVAFADLCIARRRTAGTVAVLAFVTLAALVGVEVLQRFPNSGDEYNYVYQARTFASGRLSNPGHLPPDFFRFNYIVQDEGREYSSFPLGWPLFLAAAAWLQVPLWLVNPILGGVSLLLVAGLGQRLYGPRIGVLAALLVATSGFFLFNAASFFSHTFCGTLLLAAAWCAARPTRAWWVPPAIGFLLGWAIISRYFTGVVCGVPIVLLLVARTRKAGGSPLAALAGVAAGGLPAVGVLAAYNTALTGNPWQLTTTAKTVSLWFASGFALRGADILATHLLRFVSWTPPLLLFVYVYYLARGAAEVRRGLLEWMPVIMAACLYAYVERGGNQYGPRFFYETFPFLVIFTTAHLFRQIHFSEKSAGERRAFGAVVLSVALAPLLIAGHALIEHRVISERRDPYRMVRQAGLEDALVLIRGRVGSVRSMGALDLTRNGITRDAEVLYGLDLGPSACRLQALHPTRALYRYGWDTVRGHGVLERLACADTARARPPHRR